MNTPIEGKGYHTTKIPKGIFGDASKIIEEYHEWFDGFNQGAKVLELVELADLLGAIEGYVKKQYSLCLQDIIQMKNLTERAFTDGTRIDKITEDQPTVKFEHREVRVVAPPKPPYRGFRVIWGDDRSVTTPGEVYWFGTTKDEPIHAIPSWWIADQGHKMRKGYVYAVKANLE